MGRGADMGQPPLQRPAACCGLSFHNDAIDAGGHLLEGNLKNLKNMSDFKVL